MEHVRTALDWNETKPGTTLVIPRPWCPQCPPSDRHLSIVEFLKSPWLLRDCFSFLGRQVRNVQKMDPMPLHVGAIVPSPFYHSISKDETIDESVGDQLGRLPVNMLL